MKNWEKKSILRGKVITGIVVGLMLASPTTIANAGHSWGSYHWARTVTSTSSNPFSLLLGSNLSTNWQTYLQIASNQWSDLTQNSVIRTSVVTGAKKGNCGAVAGRVEVCNAKYGSNGWLGIASISISGSHITQGTVKLNDTYFGTAKYNDSSWKQLVMCQEVGHTFGLGHVDETFTNKNQGTCMDYTNAPNGGIVNNFDYGASNIAPNTHDYAQLVTIYSHADSSTTIKSTPTTSGKNSVPNLNDPSSWGRPIGELDSRGRSSHFELDLGNGQKIFTFVVWADN